MLLEHGADLSRTDKNDHDAQWHFQNIQKKYLKNPKFFNYTKSCNDLEILFEKYCVNEPYELK